VTIFVALLRAVNVGGTGLLRMQSLRDLCAGLGLENPRTYIQSGNVVFASSQGEGEIQAMLQEALAEHMGKPVGVMLRNAAAMRGVLQANPFPDAPPAKVGVAFLAKAPAKRLLDEIAIPGPEAVRLGKRELYIHYPEGMGKSKLKLPKSAGPATTRNINTVAKLVAMSAA
jgi:uncharacterized protein (DUF1697 family)